MMHPDLFEVTKVKSTARRTILLNSGAGKHLISPKYTEIRR